MSTRSNSSNDAGSVIFGIIILILIIWGVVSLFRSCTSSTTKTFGDKSISDQKWMYGRWLKIQ
ncbi:MAG: hypothetical protein ABF633_01795 [Clostridium sp.]|uniref:hypothetical protein n=1 Tax=Clostridium sp. TaxID=1506 RepID=UPI0039EC48C1